MIIYDTVGSDQWQEQKQTRYYKWDKPNNVVTHNQSGKVAGKGKGGSRPDPAKQKPSNAGGKGAKEGTPNAAASECKEAAGDTPEKLYQLLKYQESLFGPEDPGSIGTRARWEAAVKIKQERDKEKKETQHPETQLKYLKDKLSKHNKKIKRAEEAIEQRRQEEQTKKDEYEQAVRSTQEAKDNLTLAQEGLRQLQDQHAALINKLKDQRGERQTAADLLHMIGLEDAEKIPQEVDDLMKQVREILTQAADKVKQDKDKQPNKDKENNMDHDPASATAEAQQQDADMADTDCGASVKTDDSSAAMPPPTKTPRTSTTGGSVTTPKSRKSCP